MFISTLLKDFFASEKAGGILLMIAAVLSITLVNVFDVSAIGHFLHTYFDLSFWIVDLNMSAEHWINDGLMTIFFLLIGLELEREIYSGELSALKKASLPIAAAVGGMAVPAAIHFFLNMNHETSAGTGIPMATDIAFALAVLSFCGKNIPTSVKVFLTALAVIDDLGAIIVIALFYSHGVAWGFLLAALVIWGLLFILNRMKVHRIWPYIIGGVLMWMCMLQSGIHATISGVMLAFVIPYGKGDETSASYRLQHILHTPVAYIVLPIFAFANTAIDLQAGSSTAIEWNNSLGIVLGLAVGKPIGVLLLTYLAVRLGWSALPEGMNYKHVLGTGMLAGIGFTMSIFITLLAFQNPDYVQQSKLSIIVASVISAVFGLIFLRSIKKTTT
jgi:NhaA family Na+:H+ antiporter